MELSQYWRDMVLTPANANEARGGILDSFKMLNQAVGNTGQQ